MTVRKLVMSLIVIALGGTGFIVGTLQNVRTRIRESYPSAEVAIHEGHSPGAHPVLSFLRLVRGSHFVPVSEWIYVQLESEARPVDLAKLFEFQVISIRLTRCKIDDLTPLSHQTPPVYLELIDCDLTAVPSVQRAVLKTSPKNPDRLTYGGP